MSVSTPRYQRHDHVVVVTVNASEQEQQNFYLILFIQNVKIWSKGKILKQWNQKTQMESYESGESAALQAEQLIQIMSECSLCLGMSGISQICCSLSSLNFSAVVALSLPLEVSDLERGLLIQC